jgi:hypothetical protein
MEAIVTAESQRSLWSSLVEAVRGSHQDYTTGSLNRAILLLAVPMVLEMVFGVAVCGGGRVLGGPTGGERRGYGGFDGIDVEPGVRGRHGAEPFDDGDGGSAHWRKGSRGRGGRCGAGDCAGADRFTGDWTALLFLCAAAAAAHGSERGDCRGGQRLHADLPGRQLRRAAAVFEQRHFSRSRRCGHRHAAAVGFEHHQSGARSLPDFWLGTVSADGCNGCCAGDLHWPQHRRGLPVLPPAERDGANSYPGAANSHSCGGDVAAGADFADRHSAIRHRAHELDWAGAHRQQFRRGGTGRVIRSRSASSSS